MWSRKEAPAMAPSSRQLSFSSDSQCQLDLYLQHQVSIVEDASAILLLLGRIRPYNHRYAENDDLLWLLELWQTKTDVAQFYRGIAGFFSLVIFEHSDNSIHLINDHVASVPLYFHNEANADGQNAWLSDHLKHSAARCLPLNPQALYNYFFYHCIPSELAVLQHTQKLAPGAWYHLAASTAAAGKLAVQHQVNLYRPEHLDTGQSTAELQLKCKQVIDTAVARNLQTDCAAFLSGGLDSSTVSGLLSVYQPSTRTFSIGFDAKGYDETEYALITAKHFKTNHHVHYLQPEEIIENFVEVAAQFDEPFGNSSAMAAYICASVAKQHGVSVMLAGDGGDEIFAGNERYAKQKVFELYGALPKPLQSVLDALTHSPLGALPVLRKARSYVDQAKIPLPDRLDTYNFLNRFAPEQMFCDAFLAQVDRDAPAQAKRLRYQQSKAADPVDKMMYLDWKFTLADNDLVKVSSMCHKAGVEVRYPLFEKEVVDFSCTVPPDIKLPGNKLRDFYKNSFKGFLADETLDKAKHGFGLPFGVWMKEQPRLQQLTEQTLATLKTRQIIRPEFIDEALQIYRSGHLGYYGELIWIMVVLELWLQGWERNADAA